MMNEYSSIEEVAERIKSNPKLNNNEIKKKKIKNNVWLLYAFNATGKTRLSVELNNLIKNVESSTDEIDNERTLCYNAFTEDCFSWDNDNCLLKIDNSKGLFDIVRDEGLENSIVDVFHQFVKDEIQVQFNFDNRTVQFTIFDDTINELKEIKISKGEESIFIWSVFYAILEMILLDFKESPDDRSIKYYKDLEYIIIDDPVSSIDDTKIISMAVKLYSLINDTHIEDKKFCFVILTHHALYYNVLYNSINRSDWNTLLAFILSKSNNKYVLKKHNKDTPFAYHLVIKDEIKNAIENQGLKKSHFNLFRNLLEKTSSFLGYKNWSSCIKKTNRDEFTRMLNLYSHSRLIDLEYSELSEEDKLLFIEVFEDFISEFKLEENND